MNLDEYSTGVKLAATGALLAVLGSFLPWAEIETPFGETTTISGIEGDGLLTAISGIAVLLILFFGSWRKRDLLATGGLGSFVALLGLYHINNFSSAESEFGAVDASLSLGLYLTVAAGIVIVGGVAHTYRTRGWKPRQTGQPLRGGPVKPRHSNPGPSRSQGHRPDTPQSGSNQGSATQAERSPSKPSKQKRPSTPHHNQCGGSQSTGSRPGQAR